MHMPIIIKPTGGIHYQPGKEPAVSCNASPWVSLGAHKMENDLIWETFHKEHSRKQKEAVPIAVPIKVIPHNADYVQDLYYLFCCFRSLYIDDREYVKPFPTGPYLSVLNSAFCSMKRLEVLQPRM